MDRKASTISFLAGALAATLFQYLISKRKKEGKDKVHGKIIPLWRKKLFYLYND
jgi:hypothetical protein